MKRTQRPWIRMLLLLAYTTGMIFLTGLSCSIKDKDSDGDLISDEWETRYGFDPRVKNTWLDSDKDGLTDLVEFQLYQKYKLALDPHDPDSDDDGLPDGAEVCYDFDCKTYAPGKDTDPTNPDSDSDGINDGMEVGLIKGETLIGSLTNPLKKDTDDDGVDDAAEYRAGNDPNRSNRPFFYDVSPSVVLPNAKVNLHGQGFGNDPHNLCKVIVNGITTAPNQGSNNWTLGFQVPDKAKLNPWSRPQVQVVCKINGLPYASNTDKNLIVVDPAKNEFPQDMFADPPDLPAQSRMIYYGSIDEDGNAINCIDLTLRHSGRVTIKASIIDPDTGQATISSYDIRVINDHFIPCDTVKRDKTDKGLTTFIATIKEAGKYYICMSTQTEVKMFNPMFYRVEVYVENLP